MDAKIGRRLIIEHFGCIIIHNNAIIGDDVVIRQGVTIGNRSIDRPLDVPHIGNRVNIGAGAKLLGPITIGDDVNIGANAVVLATGSAKTYGMDAPLSKNWTKGSCAAVFPLPSTVTMVPVVSPPIPFCVNVTSYCVL